MLFDFDGVLARTMEDNTRAWIGALAAFGAAIAAEEYLRLEGAGTLVVATTLLAARGLDTALASDVVEEKERRYLADHRFALYPGVDALLDELHARDIGLALVTGANRPRLERTVGADFLGRFGAIVTGDLLGHPKPHPEPFRRGAEGLRVAPRDCVAVENAPLGIRSARDAGAWCIAITTTLSAEALAGADEVVADHAELRERLHSLT